VNIQIKIIIPLLFLVASGCVHHQRRYANEYEYGRSYNSYYDYPAYGYDRRVYVQQPIIVEGSRQHTHQPQERQRYITPPSKHQKPKHERYNAREYRQSTRKQTKAFVTKQPRYITPPSKHQKSKYERHHVREYQQPTRKQTKAFVVKQPRYNKYDGRAEQYKNQPRPSTQYQKSYKAKVNSALYYSSGYRQEPSSTHKYSRNRSLQGSKHRKTYQNTSQKDPMGKAFKR
jgi:hypothetical protein